MRHGGLVEPRTIPVLAAGDRSDQRRFFRFSTTTRVPVAVAPIDGWDSGARAPPRHGAIRTSSELMNQRKSDVEWIDTSFA
jgi:hypothetical protein